MAVILAISSQVAYGRVGLSAYSFALQKLGHEVICLPTVNWLTHPKLGRPIGEVTNADKLADMGAELISLRLEEKIDYIISGYFANAEQAHSVKWLVTQLKTKNPEIQYCCDPVMGDEPKGLYVAEDVAQYIKDYLAPMADLVTPNAFEAKYLGELRAKKILQKSANQNIYTENAVSISQKFSPIDVHLNGAGDLLTALFIGYQLNGLKAEKALAKATLFLQKCAEYTAKHGCAQLPVIELQEYL
ncbi:MAG: bifunctional hydroxymethylpyrimidine kinase/phosphomethylpyrimidine kinase [Alphaproteobacteria bacterium]|nr:bifunctional hydroxymethylpyrimidine kinase/phosphomethylpyrimidine kinase [Alphaproteobacteria bacterium]